MLVDGRQRDESFQRKTGYVQQQDLHLPTSTVREALEFSAVLRQPAHVSRREKLDYADEVIKLLGMESYADAVVGVPGEGNHLTPLSLNYLTRFYNVTDSLQVSTLNNANVSPLALNSQRSRSFFCSWTSPPPASTVRHLGLSLT